MIVKQPTCTPPKHQTRVVRIPSGVQARKSKQTAWKPADNHSIGSSIRWDLGNTTITTTTRETVAHAAMHPAPAPRGTARAAPHTRNADEEAHSRVTDHRRHTTRSYRSVAGEEATCRVKRCGIGDIHGAALTDVFGEPSDRTPEQRPSNEPAMSRTARPNTDAAIGVYPRRIYPAGAQLPGKRENGNMEHTSKHPGIRRARLVDTVGLG